ncbi:hypothetical protein V3C99_003964 [Haemonchus contortus]
MLYEGEVLLLAYNISCGQQQLNVMAEDEEVQLCKAHERIRQLNADLVAQGDTSEKIAELRKKIALSKERAQGIVSMANKRLAYVTVLWSEKSQIDQKKTEKTDSLKVELAAAGCRVNLKCASSKPRKTKILFRSPFKSEPVKIDPKNNIMVLTQAIAILDDYSRSPTLLDESKTESARLAKDIRDFLAKLNKQTERNDKKAAGTSNSLPTTSQATCSTTFENLTSSGVPSINPFFTGIVNASSSSGSAPPTAPASAQSSDSAVKTAAAAAPVQAAPVAPATPVNSMSTNSSKATPPPAAATPTLVTATQVTPPTTAIQATPVQAKTPEQPKAELKQEPAPK